MALQQMTPELDVLSRGDAEELDDDALIPLLRKRETVAFEFVIRRHNRRLYRVARSILRNDTEAEDAVQQAYVKALTALESFRGDSSLSTCLQLAADAFVAFLRDSGGQAFGGREERPALPHCPQFKSMCNPLAILSPSFTDRLERFSTIDFAEGMEASHVAAYETRAAAAVDPGQARQAEKG